MVNKKKKNKLEFSNRLKLAADNFKKDFTIIKKTSASAFIKNYRKFLVFIKNLPKLSLAFIKSLPSMWRARVNKWRASGGYISFKRENRKMPKKWVASPISLISQTFTFLKQHWRVLTPITMLYSLLYLVIVRVNISFDQTSSVDAAQAIFKASGTPILARISSLAGVVSSYRPSGSEQANILSSVLIVLFSLIYIWAIRALSMNKKIRARDALYSGTSNLLPFMFMMSVLAIQLLPLTLAVTAYNIGDNGLIFIYWYERTAALVGLGLIALLSLYFISNTIMALYACTIQGVYPVPVMRSTRDMVRFQRLRILVNLVVGIFIMFFLYLCLLLIVVTYAPKLTSWMLDLFNILSLPIIHTYLYKMYRSML